jgi:phage shock protein E
MKNYLFFILLSFVLTSCVAQDTAHYKVINQAEYEQAIKSNQQIQLVDVRTPEEYNEGHLENALNININHSNFKELVQKLDKEKPIYIYCRSGVRSRKAGAVLEKMGFKQIFDLQGGILSWTGKTIK